MTALQLRNERAPMVPFILVTGTVNEEVAVECMKAGADDYILKDNLSRLGPAILNSVKKSKLTSAKRAAEEELQKSERRLQKAQALAHVGNWELDLSRKTMWGSDEALRIYGLNQDSHEIPYKIAMKSPLPEYRAMLDEALDRLLKHNEPYDIEFKIRRENDGAIRSVYSKAELVVEPDIKEEMKHGALEAFKQKASFENFINTNIHKDGNEVILSTSGIPMIDSNGTLTGYRGVDTDITLRKRAEEAAEQERRTLRTLIDNLPDPIYVQDKECRKVIANKADVKNIGAGSENEVIGKTDLDLFPGEAGERGYAEDKKVILSGKPILKVENEFVNSKGERLWLQTTKIPLQDKDGNVTGLVGIGHDITERKQIIEELIRAKEKAEESDKLKTAFLHNISHEIRTPMNAIVGFSALLGEPDIDEKVRASYIEVIMQSSNHLLSIISDIVDISNIEANLIKTLSNEVSVNSILKSLYNQFIQRAHEKKIELVCEPGLSDSEAIILTDSTKLTQILTNLVSNALKFTDKGQIRIWYGLKDNDLEFGVSDTGIGISKEHHESIFNRFYQVQSNITRLYEGTGLGLSISKAYAEHLGGKIWLFSEPGTGTSLNHLVKKVSLKFYVSLFRELLQGAGSLVLGAWCRFLLKNHYYCTVIAIPQSGGSNLMPFMLTYC